MSNDPRPTALRPAGLLALKGWCSWLATAVSGSLALLALSGLWLLWAPFSVASQVLVLVHVVIGLLVVILLPRYAACHVADWWRQKVSLDTVLGYALLAAVMAALTSGVACTSLAFFGSRLPPAWVQIHQIAGLAVPVLLMSHLTLAFLRSWRETRRDGFLRVALHRFPRRLAVLVGVSAALGLTILHVAVGPPEDRSPRDAEVHLGADTDQHLVQGGIGSFAQFLGNPAELELAAKSLSTTSTSCGASGCHEQIHMEWELSAHRFAATNPSFQVVLRISEAELDSRDTRSCLVCHDPLALVGTTAGLSSRDLSVPVTGEGVSCVVCHALSGALPKAGGRREAEGEAQGRPLRYLGEGRDGWSQAVTRFLIRADPREHLATYDRQILDSPDFCRTCHSGSAPDPFHGSSRAADEDPAPGGTTAVASQPEPSVGLTCQDCHMPWVKGARDSHETSLSKEFWAAPGKGHRNHVLKASREAIPALLGPNQPLGWAEQPEESRKGDSEKGEAVKESPDEARIVHAWTEGEKAGIRVEVLEEGTREQALEVQVTVVQGRTGHHLIAEPLRFSRTWIHLLVFDAEGKNVAEWQGMDERDQRSWSPPKLGQEGTGGRSEPSLEFGLKALVEDDRGPKGAEPRTVAEGRDEQTMLLDTIQSRRYQLHLPADAQGPLILVARLRSQRLRQDLRDLLIPGLEEETQMYQPTVTRAQTARRIDLEGP